MVNISTLEAVFAAGDTVSPATLRERGLIHGPKGRKVLQVKILGEGALTKKLVVTGCATSASAKAAIEKAGGTLS